LQDGAAVTRAHRVAGDRRRRRMNRFYFRSVLETFATTCYPPISFAWVMGVFHGSECRSRGVRRGGVVAHGCHRRYRGGAGSPPKSARAIRLLRVGALLVAVVLRGRRRARHTAAAAMRRAALFLRRARPVAAIRKRLPGILSAAG